MRHQLLFLFLVLATLPLSSALSQDRVVTLSMDMFDNEQVIFLSNLDGWLFKQGNDPAWADPGINTDDWELLKPAGLTFDHADESGKVEGWFRIKFELDSTFTDIPLSWRSGTFGALEIYLDGERVQSYGKPDSRSHLQQNYNPYNKVPDPADLQVGREYNLAVYFADHHSWLLNKYTFRDVRLDPWLRLAGPEYTEFIRKASRSYDIFQTIWFTALTLLTFLFWIISLQTKREKLFRLIAWLNTALLVSCISSIVFTSFVTGYIINIFELLFSLSLYVGLGLVPIVFAQILKGEIPEKLIGLFWIYLLCGFFDFWFEHFAIIALIILVVVIISIYYVVKFRTRISKSQWMVVSGLISTILWMLLFVMLQIFVAEQSFLVQNIIITFIYLSLPVSLLMFISVRYKETLTAIQKNAKEIVQLTNEKQKAAENQKELLEKEVEARTQELRVSLENLRAAQEQLVQQEKLASLGQLTAGIAHEIKNPLNFVNNFSEVSLELIEEVRDEVKREKESPFEGGAELPDGTKVGDDAYSTKDETSSLILEILDDIEANLRKIHEHGSRADGIVKSMLLHSRGGSGKMEPTDLNAMVHEYVNLAFHGMRAGKEPINVDIDVQFDESIGEVPLIAEDFSRVILNLCNNAFDAMREKANSPFEGGAGAQAEVRDDSSLSYHPKLTVRTHQIEGSVIIEIEDNGPGIPDDYKDKILQPFFTTKKGTQGTGLGLSITNDIVKAHGGELSLESNPQAGTKFRIAFPNK